MAKKGAAKVSSLTLNVNPYDSSMLVARWTAPTKKTVAWTYKRKKGGKFEKNKKGKKILFFAVSGYTVTWKVTYPTVQYNSKGKPSTKYTTITENSSTVGAGILTASFSIPANADSVACVVKPNSKTYKNKKNKDTPYFTSAAAFSQPYNPKGTFFTPSAPSVSITNGKLKATLANVGSNLVTNARFEVVEDNKTSTTADISVSTGYASYEQAVNPGHTYKVRVRVWGAGYAMSAYSDYSENVESEPAAVNDLILTATSSTSVNVKWPSMGNDVQYELEWYSKPRVSNPETFDTTSTISSQTCQTNEWNVTGLDGGTWYFRVRVVSNNSKSAWFPETETDRYVILGRKPSPPTTYTLLSSIKVNDTIDFRWVHNSEDGSSWTYSELEFTFKSAEVEDIVERKIIPNNAYNQYGMLDGDEENPSYSINTSVPYKGTNYNTGNPFEITFRGGVTIEWRVRTKGAVIDETGWSDWSVIRTVDVWAEPTLTMIASATLDGWLWDPFNFNKDSIYTAPQNPIRDEDDIFTSMPIGISLVSGPSNQTPIGYNIQVVAKDPYSYVNEFGDTVSVNADEVIFSKYLISDNHEFVYMLTPFNISLQDGEKYKIIASVVMNSGLSTTEEYEFKIDWEEIGMYPRADITIDTDKLYATIVPYCTDTSSGVDIPEDAEEGDEIEVDDEEELKHLVPDVLLSVYRISVDGELVEVYSGLENDKKTSIVDPHPTLDEVSYRIVAYNMATGQMTYDDTSPEDVPQPGVVISWDERWYNTTEDMQYDDENEDEAVMDDVEYTGVQLKLPYNVDISESMSPDVNLINYIGRKRPVGYYGTQLGESATWKTEIPKVKDDEVFFSDYMSRPWDALTLLRRLAVYTGDVYVRESAGRTGYWANVKVSFDISHSSLVIPVTLTVTRVEGGA